MRNPYTTAHENYHDFKNSGGINGDTGLLFTDDELENPAHAALYLQTISHLRYIGEKPQRGWECAYLYSTGDTLEAIAYVMQVSRERVRQIINNTHAYISCPKIARARRTHKNHAIKQLQRAVYEWSISNPVQKGEVCEEKFGITRLQVKHILKGRSALHYPVEPRIEKIGKEWSDQEIIELLRQWWAECSDHTSMSFEKWSVARGGPTRQTPIHRFEKWSKALEAAELQNAKSKYRNRRGRYSNTDMWAAVVQFVKEPRESYTFSKFETYLRQIPGMPSAASVRIKLNLGWNTQLEIAKKIIRHDYAGLGEDFTPERVKDIERKRDWSTNSVISVDEYLDEAVRSLQSYMKQQNTNRIVITAYNKWAKANKVPMSNTLINRTGLTWAELTQHAGGTCGNYAPRCTSDEEIQLRNEYALACIREYLEQEQGSPAYERYIAWAKQAGDSYPKGTALASWFGGWRKALHQAQKQQLISLYREAIQ